MNNTDSFLLIYMLRNAKPKIERDQMEYTKLSPEELVFINDNIPNSKLPKVYDYIEELTKELEES